MIAMPCFKQLRLRIVRIKVEIQGFRVHQYDLVTTLTDADIYTKDELQNSISGAGQWSCSFAKSRRLWEWKSCAAELSKWIAKNCGCT